MHKYATKQRKILLDYFEKNVDRPLSAKQIASVLSGEQISLSAVYRNLSELEQEGKLRRYNDSSSREVIYRYSGGVHCKSAVHLACTKCKKTFHMDCDSVSVLTERLKDIEDFELNKEDTVLYGVCKLCRG